MSANDNLVEKYNDLRTGATRMASAFASLRQAIDSGDISIASDIATIFEYFAFDVLEAHPCIEEAEA